jgi:hypothetical protein
MLGVSGFLIFQEGAVLPIRFNKRFRIKIRLYCCMTEYVTHSPVAQDYVNDIAALACLTFRSNVSGAVDTVTFHDHPSDGSLLR